MKIENKMWIEAAKILEKDPLAKVQCPECKVGTLIIKDEPLDARGDRIDRYLICDNCGKWNVITMRFSD
jgi:hypothetical protein